MRDPARCVRPARLLGCAVLFAAFSASATSELFSEVESGLCRPVEGTTSAVLGPCATFGPAAVASASADFGHVATVYRIDGIARSVPVPIVGLAFASFLDTVVFDPQDPGLIGTPGSVILKFDFTGNMSTNLSGIIAIFVAGGRIGDDPWSFFDSLQEPGSKQFMGRHATAPLDIIWGTPVELKVQLGLSPSVPPASPGQVEILMDFALDLRRIAGFDENGVAAPFSIFSESGTEYPAVPEPAGLGLLLLGSAFWVRARRRPPPYMRR